MCPDPIGRTRRGSAGAESAVVEGGCHCGRVAFAVQGWPRRALLCNCSICTMKGYLHWIVARERFRLVAPAGLEELGCYRFGTGSARHYFCPGCGVAPFYVPRSDPDKVDVNLRCVRGVDLARVALDPFDGQNWEQAYRAYAGPPGSGAGGPGSDSGPGSS